MSQYMFFCVYLRYIKILCSMMKIYERSPDRKRALSTVGSSANLIWQKFFLLLRMAVISPHWPNTSMMSCSVAFSGKPPTNTVLQPGGRSLVAGGGRSERKRRKKIMNTNQLNPVLLANGGTDTGKTNIINNTKKH